MLDHFMPPGGTHPGKSRRFEGEYAVEATHEGLEVVGLEEELVSASVTSSGTPKTDAATTGTPKHITSSMERGSDSTSEADNKRSVARYH